MRRGNLMELINRLQHQRAVALHNPQWDLFVPFPGRVLDNDPAMLLRLIRGHAHGIVIVHIHDFSGSAFIAD